MVVIAAQSYAEARVHTIKVGNRELFWVKMIDVQKSIRVKNISHLVKKQIQGMYETKYPTEEEKRKYTRTTEELTVYSYHVTYAFQSESTLYSCLNFKEFLARSRREI